MHNLVIPNREHFLTGAPAPSHPLLLALWHAGHGGWDKAHEIVQEGTDRKSAAVHAFLHRQEGDAGNAAYWYRQAGRSAFTGTLEEEWQTLVDEFLRSSSNVSGP